MKHRYLSPLRLLPPTSGTCPECAVDHHPEEPHNRDSLTYQYRFYDANGRWPMWDDAMAHCDERTRELWREELRARGIQVA